jgi:ribosomal protein S18 acetylase RimI-like enzyme
LIAVRIIDEQNKADVRIPNEPFQTFGRIIPSYTNGEWGYRLVRFAPDDIGEMCFPDENYDYDKMKDGVFIGAYDEDKCVGLILLQQACFKYMYVADLKVNKDYRRRYIGRMLTDKAKEVAAQHGYRGLYLQCQDNNPGACLFYLSAGFYIGGLDTNVYRHTKQEGKSDIIFYCEIDR